MTGIFSFEDEAPIENWLFNSVENLKGTTIDVPLNWMDISQLIHSLLKSQFLIAASFS